MKTSNHRGGLIVLSDVAWRAHRQKALVAPKEALSRSKNLDELFRARRKLSKHVPQLTKTLAECVAIIDDLDKEIQQRQTRLSR